jgi:hypothetical protein
MTAVIYTASQSILPGHSASSDYSLDLRMIDAEPTRLVQRSDQQALSGRREVLVWNRRDGLNITIGSYPEVSTESAAVIEFLDSVSGGEPFVFDRWGRAGAPANPRNAVMLSAYTVIRYGRVAGEGNDLMRYSFAIEFI